MMDIKGNQSSSVVNVTSMLVRAAVTKNHENRELISEPVQKKDKVQEPKPVKPENSADKSTVTPTDAPNTQASQQTTGRLVNVSV